MSWDFWAGYVSGAAGIIVGSPLDLLKVQRQAGYRPSWKELTITHESAFRTYTSLARGALAPILGYGALNGLLFVTYNRTLLYMEPRIRDITKLSGVEPWKIWLAGAGGGLASWAVSAPTELIKCRKQLGDYRGVMHQVCDMTRKEGLSGLYRGGAITSIRDAVGYGFYFWTYESLKMFLESNDGDSVSGSKVMLCGGTAGVATWVSIYPLDVVKTRLQGADLLPPSVRYHPRNRTESHLNRTSLTTIKAAQAIFHEGGLRAFFNGLGACSARAFLVNAVQWYIYEAVMRSRPPQAVAMLQTKAAT